MTGSSDNEVDAVADQLNFTQLDPESHWEGFWDAAFAGDRE